MSVDSFLPWRLAQWNPTRGVWETGQLDLLSGLSELYLETWPTSGMTHGGVAYELPTPELPTDASASSSLRTPTARDSAASGGSTSSDVTLTDAVVRTELGSRPNPRHLLKTPTSQLAVNGGSQHPDKGRSGGHGPTLADEVEHLLPTPAAHDSGNSPEEHLRKKPGRSVVTSLQVLVDYDLLRSGGRIVPQSSGGKPLWGVVRRIRRDRMARRVPIGSTQSSSNG